MHVLVTGGLGFLGRAVTLDLLDAGYRVTVLTRGRPAANPPAATPPAGAGLVTGDLRDRQRMREVVAGLDVDGVVHLAALTRARDSLTDPLSYFDVNTGGTLNLLLALDAVRAGRPPARLVFASTNIVYGSVHTGALSESLDPHPESPYAASKLAAELLIGAHAATGAIGAATLRCFNLAGAAGGVTDTDPTRILPNVLRTLTGHLPHVTLNGDGSAVRDFVHVADVATAVRLALDTAAPGTHEIFNIGSGTGTSMAQVISTVEATLGRPVPVVRTPPRPEPQVLTADIGRARTRLGWSPARSDLQRIITDAWKAWPEAAG